MFFFIFGPLKLKNNFFQNALIQLCREQSIVVLKITSSNFLSQKNSIDYILPGVYKRKRFIFNTRFNVHIVEKY